MVIDAVERPQHALLLGMDPVDREAVQAAARSAGLEPAHLADVAALTTALDALETPVACLLVDAFDDEIASRLASMPHDARIATVPVLARVAHPAESAFLRAIRAGADDAIVRYDYGGLVRRITAAADAKFSTSAAATHAIIADENPVQRALYGRALRRCGIQVTFASDATSAKEAITSAKALDAVIICETLLGSGRRSHGWVRDLRKNHTLPIVILQEPGDSDHYGGHRTERTGWLPRNAPAENLLFVLNELFSSEAHNQRASARVLYTTLCSFRRANDLVPEYGVTYNISRDGIFVRTLSAPKLGEAVWLEMRPPGELRAVHLRGNVVWVRKPGSTGAPAPPGFAVHLLPQQCPPNDLDRYRTCYSAVVNFDSEDDAPPSSRGEPDAHDGPHLLVADDEKSILQVYKRIFGRKNIRITAAADGEDAVRKFRAGRFDAVLTDIHMPRLDGIQLLKAIRAHDDRVPVLITTGQPSTETAIEALDHGALRYIVKPFVGEDLIESVEHAVQMGRLARFRREAAKLVSEADVSELGKREQLGESLTRAVEHLAVHLQPIVEWSTRSVQAFEALARTTEPSLPHPGALFDAANRLDRLSEVSRGMFALASNAMAGRSEDLYVNLHPRDLLDEHLYDSDSLLSKVANRVVLEITERASLNGIDELRSRILRLREIGFRIAVDDLGAGYSGLAAFCALQPDVAKIDMSLVRDIHQTATKQRIVSLLADACNDLNISLIAEGVETVDELKALIDLGCDRFQGYLFARPGPPFVDVGWPTL